MKDKKASPTKNFVNDYVIKPINVATDFVKDHLKELSAFGILAYGSFVSVSKALAQETQVKTYLTPYTWSGSVISEFNAWVTGNTLTSPVPRIIGPARIENARSYQVDGNNKLIESSNGVYFKVADPEQLEAIINRFEENNQFANKEALKNLLKGTYLPLRVINNQAIEVFNQALRDGQLTREELNNISNGFYGFWYISEDNKASLPGLVYINYDKSEESEAIKELERQLAELKEDKGKVLSEADARRELLTEDFEAGLAQTIEEYETKLTEARLEKERTTISHEAELARLEEQYEEAQSRLVNVETIGEKLRVEHEAELARLEEQYKIKLAEAEKAQVEGADETREQLITEYEGQLAQLREQHETRLGQALEEASRELEQLKVVYNQQSAELRSEYEAKLEESNLEKEQIISELEKKIAEIRKEYGLEKEDELSEKVSTERKPLIFLTSAGFDYDTQNRLMIPQLAIKAGINKWALGLTTGFFQRSFENPDKVTTNPEDPVTGFYGHGIVKEKGIEQILEILGGLTILIGENAHAEFNGGVSVLNKTTNTESTGQIYNRDGNVVAEDKDTTTISTSTIRPKITTGFGLNSNSERMSIGLEGLIGFVYNPIESIVYPILGARGSIKF